MPTQLVVSTCTVADCGIGLAVVLSGTVPNDYTLMATTPAGEEMGVRCVGGVGRYPDDFFPRNDYAVCTPKGVSFLRFSPDEVTITVTWDEHTLMRDYRPVYELDYPNGPDCSPECRVGQVTFTLTGD